MKKLVLIGVLLLLVVSLTGCNEPEKKVWGKGELPPDFTSFFGTDNNARLNKAQNDMLNKHEALILGVDNVKDGKKVHTNGIIDLMRNLQGRVAALEAVDPNALEPRIKALEEARAFQDSIDEAVIKAMESEDEMDPRTANDILEESGVLDEILDPNLKKKLKSLEEHNSEIFKMIHDLSEPQPNGIACPECGAELLDTAPDMMLTSYPEQYYVGCSKCDYTGTRF